MGRFLTFERKLALGALVATLPGLVLAGVLAWRALPAGALRWVLLSTALAASAAVIARLRSRLVLRLKTLSNLVSALREGDYSVRGRDAERADPVGEVVWEVNALGDKLRTVRLGELEASALLGQVLEEIDVAIFAFDGAGLLRLVNRAGAKLLQRPPSQLLGRDAASLGMEGLLEGETPRRLSEFGGQGGPYELRRSQFRREGLPHTLLVLADLRRVVREEERAAWQRIVRVLSHEINNSLAPIQSIAASLQAVLGRGDPSEWLDDVRSGLTVVARRSEALSRFLAAYARLAKLPPPTLAPVSVPALVQRVIALDRTQGVRVVPGPPAWVRGDADQLEQLLINLLKNAVEAASETGGGVSIGWEEAPGEVELVVSDEGPGLLDSRNLFVPFYTTKPAGSGIGLVLCRQIAEAHRGTLSLLNAVGRRGCDARLRLPRVAPPQQEASLPAS
ncbi:MAG TPA: ATP-binding protein [Myxococcaceae bacterium]|nr:ATP-binding protein [Myxococcaceae bacterium]